MRAHTTGPVPQTTVDNSLNPGFAHTYRQAVLLGGTHGSHGWPGVA